MLRGGETVDVEPSETDYCLRRFFLGGRIFESLARLRGLGHLQAVELRYRQAYVTSLQAVS